MTHNNRLIAAALIVGVALGLFLGWYIAFIELVRP
jgi:hypothetical protein